MAPKGVVGREGGEVIGRSGLFLSELKQKKYVGSLIKFLN